MVVFLAVVDCGVQSARLLVLPKGRRQVFEGDDALDLAAGYGLVADEWQAAAVRAWMGSRPRGGWAAGRWAVSVARQNGKNAILEVVELHMMVNLGLRILHTAHEVKTARKAFKRLQYFFGEKVEDPSARFPELNALVVELRRTNGQEAILLSNGGSIELGARTQGAGRGGSFDVLVMDEAQELEDDELEALLPVVSAAPDPVTIMIGTPPAVIGRRGEPFVRWRVEAERAHKAGGKSDGLVWVEHSPAGDPDLMGPVELARFVADRKNWALGNPAWGARIRTKTIEDEFRSMSPRSFARERLNMWPDVTALESAFDMDAWGKLVEPAPSEDWPLRAVGLDMNPERTEISLSAVVERADGRFHVELVDTAEAGDGLDDQALVDWVWRRCRRRVPVVMDAFSPIRSVEPLLKQRKMKVFVLSGGELAQACMGWVDSVRSARISHFGQEHLDSAARAAVRAPFGKNGAFKFVRKDDMSQISELYSAVAALFGATKFGARPKRDGGSGGSGGMAVIL